MSNKSSRAFFISLMNREQMEQLHSTERRLDPRFLLPCEISELFNLTAGSKTDEEWKYVEELEREHGKQIWKYRQLEKIGQVPARGDIEELHDFDEYVSLNWNFAKPETMSDY